MCSCLYIQISCTHAILKRRYELLQLKRSSSKVPNTLMSVPFYFIDERLLTDRMPHISSSCKQKFQDFTFRHSWLWKSIDNLRSYFCLDSGWFYLELHFLKNPLANRSLKNSSHGTILGFLILPTQSSQANRLCWLVTLGPHSLILRRGFSSHSEQETKSERSLHIPKATVSRAPNAEEAKQSQPSEVTYMFLTQKPTQISHFHFSQWLEPHCNPVSILGCCFSICAVEICSHLPARRAVYI